MEPVPADRVGYEGRSRDSLDLNIFLSAIPSRYKKWFALDAPLDMKSAR